jgi:hypothetical protein
MNKTLRSLLLSTAVATTMVAPFTATANEEVEKLSHDPANWATWGGNYFGREGAASSVAPNQTLVLMKGGSDTI